jgi:hypothetical protein
MAPVVTPQLAKKITSLRLAGTNLDDLSEGIQPFYIIVIMDHTTASGEGRRSTMPSRPPKTRETPALEFINPPLPALWIRSMAKVGQVLP